MTMMMLTCRFGSLCLVRRNTKFTCFLSLRASRRAKFYVVYLFSTSQFFPYSSFGSCMLWVLYWIINMLDWIFVEFFVFLIEGWCLCRGALWWFLGKSSSWCSLGCTLWRRCKTKTPFAFQNLKLYFYSVNLNLFR